MVIDEGTTGTRALIFDKDFNVTSQAYDEITQYTPKEDRVEHDPEEIYAKSVSMCKKAIEGAGIDPGDIDCIGITNQRNTLVLWDKTTGKPLYNAIVWQDTRVGDICNEIKKTPWFDKILQTTGKVMAPHCVVILTKWLMDNVPGVKEKMDKGDVLLGTIDSWLIWKLTSGRVHATCFSDAASAGYLDIHRGVLASEFLSHFGVPERIFPKVQSESSDYGTTDVFGRPIPITGAVADQQSALFAEGCYEKGMVKCTNGTGTFMDINIGTKCTVASGGLDTLIAWKLGDEIVYAAEGYEAVTGAAVQWLRSGLEMITASKDTEAIASSVSDSNGVFFVPALAGLITPQQDPFARGLIIGLNMGVKKAHIVRATLEGIAFRTKDIIDVVERETGIKIIEMKIDGGASNNNLLAQLMADFMNAKVSRPKLVEATSIGAAQFAGLYTGFYTWDDFKKTHEIQYVFEPKISAGERNEKYGLWKRAIERSREWLVH
jgi:glycerol kinase